MGLDAAASDGGLLDWSVAAASNLTELAIYVTVGTAVWRFWRRTLGRRRELAHRLKVLAPLMQVDWFVAQLGVPALRHQGEEASDDLTWIHPDAFIRAQACRGTVTVFAVTTRSRWFRPSFFKGRVISQDGATLEIKLGKTTYGQLAFRPEAIHGDIGARRLGYSEVRYFGNPGGYMTQIHSINDAGWLPPRSRSLLTAVAEEGSLRAQQPTDGSDILEQLPRDVRVHRQRAVFNTIAITSPHWAGDTDELGWAPGADSDVVRLTNLVGGRSRRQVTATWLGRHLPTP